MNREIKFRGFHEDSCGKETIYVNGHKCIGEWVYGYYLKTYDEMNDSDGYTHYIIDLQNDTVEGFCEFNIYCNEIIPETVSQYINSKDNNGQEIYEKDYIEYNTSYIRRLKKGIVTYDSSMCAFEIVKSLNKKDISCGDIFDYEDNKWTCEVIGTIFDEEVEE